MLNNNPIARPVKKRETQTRIMIAGGVAKRQKERHSNGVELVQRAEKRRKQFIRLRTNRAIRQV